MRKLFKSSSALFGMLCVAALGLMYALKPVDATQQTTTMAAGLTDIVQFHVGATTFPTTLTRDHDSGNNLNDLFSDDGSKAWVVTDIVVQGVPDCAEDCSTLSARIIRVDSSLGVDLTLAEIVLSKESPTASVNFTTGMPFANADTIKVSLTENAGNWTRADVTIMGFQEP